MFTSLTKKCHFTLTTKTFPWQRRIHSNGLFEFFSSTLKTCFLKNPFTSKWFKNMIFKAVANFFTVTGLCHNKGRFVMFCRCFAHLTISIFQPSNTIFHNLAHLSFSNFQLGWIHRYVHSRTQIYKCWFILCPDVSLLPLPIPDKAVRLVGSPRRPESYGVPVCVSGSKG